MDHKNTSARGRERPQRPHPSHAEVAAVLRSRIRNGELRPGQRMPTQARLADEFGVERGAVRQALRILQAERLLTNVSKGSPATVAPDLGRALTGPEAPPMPTMVALAPRVAEAFKTPHVQIDALCLTSVSFNLALGEPLRRIHAGELKPAKVTVRVLTPSRRIDIAFPTSVDAPTDERVRGHWLAHRNAQVQVLRHNLTALRLTHGIDVRVSLRELPFTPPVKLYLLNQTEALFAYYTLQQREQEVDQESYRVYDAEGTRSMLFAFEQGNGPRDTAFVEQSRRWFDSLWDTISSDMELN